jgi:protein SCO1/2
MKNNLIIAALIIVSFMMGLFLFQPRLVSNSASYGNAAIGGAFSLTDQNGKRVTDQNFKGKYTLVFFGFTSCPDVCPTTLLVITQVMEGLGVEGKNLVPIFISVDAGGDTPAVMKSYLSNFHPSIVGLTGSAVEIKQAADAYHVYYAKIAQPELAKGYTMDHSTLIHFMDKDGHLISVFTYNNSAKNIIAAIKPYLM